MTVKEFHPYSALARQIEQLLWGSIILSAATATISLVNMGRLSLFMAPIAFLFTLIHHSVLLRFMYRDRRKESSETPKNELLSSSYKVSIISCWVLILVWTAVVLAVIFVSVMIMSTNEYEVWERLAGYLEIPFEVAETCVLVVLAFKCRKQRRRTLAAQSVEQQKYTAA